MAGHFPSRHILNHKYLNGMKRLLLAFLPFFLLGCSSDVPEKKEQAEYENNVPITFDVSTENVKTRAEAITDANFATDNRQFRIWGWMTDTEADDPQPIRLMSNYNTSPLYGLEVTCQSGTWSIDPSFGVFYWPRPKYRIDCYAVYPKDARFNASAKSFDYTDGNPAAPVPGNADIMYATYQGKRAGRDLSEKSKAVELSFSHILSQVQFKASKSSELTVSITSLEICNVHCYGTFTVGVIGTDTPSWDTPTGLRSYSLPLKSASVSLTGEAQSLNAADGMLMLIPQTRTKWDTSQTIAANDAGGGAKGTYLKIGCSVTMGGSEYSDNGYVYLPLDIDWTMGYNYTYTLGFGTGYASNGEKTLTDITLTATVTDWVEGTSESQSGIVI